jgi:thiol-disulfide isomerase/thioredoxin
MQKSFMAVVASLVALAVVLVGFGAARERRAATANTNRSLAAPLAVLKAVKAQPDPPKGAAEDPADENPASVIRFVRNPSPTPPFLVNDLNGNVISTAAFHGKVVLINFWATWCPPCREEIPEMIALASRYKDGLQIIGVSMDDDPPEAIRAFTRAANMNYPVVMGGEKLSDEYGGIPALPTTFVLDTNGRVVQKHMGLYPPEVYDNEIRALLGLHVDKPVETFEDTGQVFLKNVARATALPGVDFKGLTPDQKKLALKRMNSELCSCGCKLTIAQCRMNDTSCSTSQALAEKIIRQILAGTKSPPATSAQNE